MKDLEDEDLKGYKLIGADHPFGLRRGGVCIYYIESAWWCLMIKLQGSKLESLTRFYGYQQLISLPTCILPQSLSCTDLIFTDQPKLVVDSGVHSSFHPNCHCQLIHCKHKKYPPPPYPLHQCLVWDCSKTRL